MKLEWCVLLFLNLLLFTIPIQAQNEEAFEFTSLPLDHLEAFQSNGSNWKIVGSTTAPLDKKGKLNTSSGTGVLVNLPDDKNKAQLFSKMEHGDLDLEFEFLMPVGSNSGVYFQGRYEIQLLDSWGKKRSSFGDAGGIYQRWDESRPEGQKGYEGIAPSINVAKSSWFMANNADLFSSAPI